MRDRITAEPLSRRTFIRNASTAAGAVAVAGHTLGLPVLGTRTSTFKVTRRDDTIRRMGQGGNGDCHHMSWAADDRQIISVCDGMGYEDQPIKFYSNRLCYSLGSAQDSTLHDIAGYPDLSYPRLQLGLGDVPQYYGWGTLAMEGSIYQFLSFLEKDPFEHWAGAKLIYSADNGRTWRNQDGSTPVVREPPERRSCNNMAFFREPNGAFSLLSVLQMGRNYEENRDGYVYVYSMNVPTFGTGGSGDCHLHLFRAPKGRILERRSYEFFVSLKSDGSAEWSPQIERHGTVLTFPSVCSPNETPCVVYLAARKCYLMVNSGVGVGENGAWFSKPSYLGFWTASTPWGPWTQIHEEHAWTPAGDPEACCYAPRIAPKWIAEDGNSFWLVWSDYQRRAGLMEDFGRLCDRVSKKQSIDEDDRGRFRAAFRRALPQYRFNLQRVDIV